MLRQLGICFALCVALLLIGAVTVHAQEAASLEWQRCSTQQPEELECATLQVPLDYAAPWGAKIRLGMNRLKATDPAKRIGVLLFEPGGPGTAGTDIVAAQAAGIDFFSDELRQHFDIIGFDPRGVGSSTPVKCDPQLWNAIQTLVPKDKAAYLDMVTKTTAFGASCLEKTGPLLGHLDTTTVARDIDAVREALGEDKLNYLGLSYGSMVGVAYAELFPDKIRTMALDGQLDHSLPESTWHFVESHAVEDSFQRFSAWCDATEDCALHGKDVTAELDKLVQQANQTPLPAKDCAEFGQCNASVTGEDILNHIQGGLTFQNPRPEIGVGGWQALAKAIANAIGGDATELSVVIKKREIDPDFAALATECLDWTAETNSTYEGLAARRLLDMALMPHTQGATQSWAAQTRCLGWSVPVQNPPRRAVVHGAPPILLVNSTHDPSTSFAWAIELLSQVPSGVLLVRQGDGHTTYLNAGASQTRDAINQYLITGTPPAPNSVLPN